MNNYIFNTADIRRAFKKLSIKKNDKLFVTTSLGMLGRLDSKENINKIFLDLLKKSIGNKGTLFIPTYSYSFGKKKKLFNLKKTKSEIGDFGNYILKEKNVFRSKDPMISIAGIGPDAVKVLKNEKNTSYGKGCIFEKMLKFDIKILNIGLGPNWIPFIHYLDFLNNVPFRQDKYFKGIIVDGKRKIKIKWHYPVRIKNKKSRANGHIIGRMAEKNKIFKFAYIGRGRVYVANYKKLFSYLKKITKKRNFITSYYEK